MVSYQSERILEESLLRQLRGIKYESAEVFDEASLLANLKKQLELHNNTSFTEREFARIVTHLDRGNPFERAKIVRDKFLLVRDDNTSTYIEFLQQEHWCQNRFQVTNQVTMEGSYKNRYDVTILINGLPMVQIELKRRGVDLKSAFNQTIRYGKHSYGAGHGLFNYIQVFVISNGVNTRYYANNIRKNYLQTFFWTDKENNRVSRLELFVEQFLEPCHISKMIVKYIVLNESKHTLMVLRPYQYYAVEAILDRVMHGVKNGYIWHTTGSGKTLTSFKASQLLTRLPKVDKVIFVVDRRDLDYQTTKEFNAFSKDCVDSTGNTGVLVRQLSDSTRLIVTTLQKLNNALVKENHLKRIGHLQDARVVFMFDECHRSQFGETHSRITRFFRKCQMFGFTGTPIFNENAMNIGSTKHTTAKLFGDCLHKYVITDAIRDENVLPFSVEYVGKYQEKQDSRNSIDIQVEDINRKELLENPDRLNKISDYIIANHGRKTHNRTLNAIFCVSSIQTLITYYDIFRRKQLAGEHDLRIATIFSYTENEEEPDYSEPDLPGITSKVAEPWIASLTPHTRDKLEEYIGHYNEMFGTAYTTKDSLSFFNYNNEISRRLREGEIDILLVVNMYLTGYDSDRLNTLYVDKNLRYHGLIQAYSRTNRIRDERKSQGNIVCFRNLKTATDDAVTLFSDKDAHGTIFIEPYEKFVQKFHLAFAELLKVAPTVDAVDRLPSEDDELRFVRAFRELLRLHNVLVTFADFSFDDLAITQQAFEDYKSKYLDIYEKVRRTGQGEKVSVLDEVDFVVELLQRDDITVAYILRLLAKLRDAKGKEKTRRIRVIEEIMASNPALRSKKELIRDFIDRYLSGFSDPDLIEETFAEFVAQERSAAIRAIAEEEGIPAEKLDAIISDFLYSEQIPLRDTIVESLTVKPRLLERKTVAERIINRVLEFVETYITGMPV